MFVSAALGQNVCAFFSADSNAYVVREFTVTTSSGWLGLTPEAWAAMTGMNALFILRKTGVCAVSKGAGPLMEGDTILACHCAAADSLLQGITSEPVAPPSFVRRTCRQVRNIWNQMSLSVKGIIMALFCLVLSGTLTFHYFLKMNGIDALYFVITTITTTGYGDFNLAAASTAMKLFGCLLMLSGAALIAAVFSVVTELILKARFREFFNVPVFPQEKHLIVVGAQNHGLKVIQELRNAKREVVAIDDQPGEAWGPSTLKGIPVITGDPRLEDVLMKARVHKATAIIASTDNDILNLSTTLYAKRINPAIRTVIRTFDADLGIKLHSHLGIDGVISASAVSAPMFVGSTIASNTVQGFIWKNHLVLIRTGNEIPTRLNNGGAIPIHSLVNGTQLSASAYALS
jgi:voltage-gated potassium channel Kch